MNEWISVKNRLPETEEYVLIWYSYFRYGDYNRDYFMHGIARYIKRYDMWAGADYLGSNVKVYYWMPLPKPPKDLEE